MAAPSKNWTNILDTQIATDKPLDSILMTEVRDNLVFVKEWLGASYAAGAAQDHNHDGLNSASVVLANAVVTVAKLKLLQGSYTLAAAGTADVTVSQYSHWPRIRLTNGGMAPPSEITAACYMANTGGETGALDRIRLTHVQSNGSSAVVYWDYHTN